MDSFLTVSKASSYRAIDLPASYCASLTAGDEIFVESYGRKFVWDATFPSGTSTVEGESFRPTSWTSNGAFIADLNGSEKFWRQSAWFVSTAGDDENDGLTSSTPIKTDVEIQRRWGVGRRARISVPVTITYAQSPTTITNYLWECVNGGSLVLIGTPTVTKSGTVISAVQAQVRTAGSEAGWAITGTGLDASDIGKLAYITSGTAGNIGAYARILKDETGGKVRVSPFGKTTLGTVGFTQVTPVVNDVIEVRDPTTLSVGCIEGSDATNTQLVSSGYFATNGIKLAGNANNGAGSIKNWGLSFQYHGTILENLQICGFGLGGFLGHRLLGGGISGLGGIIIQRASNLTIHQSGCTGPVQLGQGSGCQILADTYFQNTSLTVARGCTANTQGVAFFDRASASSCIVVQTGGLCVQSGAVPDWGTANAGYGITVQSLSGYSYATKPTINSGLGAGREARVGGTDKLYSAVPFIEATNNAALVLTA